MSGFTVLEGLFDYSSQLTILFNCPGGVKFNNVCSRDAEISKTCKSHTQKHALQQFSMTWISCSASLHLFVFFRLKMLDIFNTIMSTMSVNTEPLGLRCLP